MVKRKKIGVGYTYNKNWIGGTYYIENLISALNTVDDKKKPHLVLLINRYSDYKAAKSNLNYPYISFQLSTGEKNRVTCFFNKVTNRIFKKHFFNQKIKNLEAVFPYYKSTAQSLAKNKIYWIADFQEYFSPEFFSNDAIEARKNSQLEIQASSENLILSSKNALEHFKLIYPEHIVKVSVLPFAVTHPPYKQLNIDSLLNKFDLPQHYFLCPNQFWKHKNQFTVLQAVNELKTKGINITVAFTGNTEDLRSPEYFVELKEYVQKHELGKAIKFLGFINRDEQLQLMNKSIAIIQPSLFEGWSTVVEDAKSMNKYLIVSNIDVHKEQLLNSTALFFNTLDAQELAACLEKAITETSLPDLYENHNYQKNIEDFGLNFLKIANQEIV
jgi:glycosyltransferase involved in cell wall biosynthesis